MTDSEIQLSPVDSRGELPLGGLAEDDALAMVESSPDGMLLTDEHGVILFANLQVEQKFGFDRRDLLGRDVECLMPERLRSAHRAHRTRYRARPLTRAMGAGIELRAQRRDGTEFPVEVSLSPIQTTGGLRVVATVRDISDRIAAESGNRTVLRALDAARDAVFIFDVASLEFSYVNDGAVAQVGYRRDELLKMTPLSIKPSFTEESFRDLIAPVVDGTTASLGFETLHRRADGTDVPVEIEMELAPDPHDSHSPRMMTVIARDISDRLERESAEADRTRSQVLISERERLATDLHDLVIQRLFGAGMSLQSVQSLATDPRLSARIVDTVGELDQAIAYLRSSIFQLTTNPREERITAIQRVVVDAESRLGFGPSLSISGDVGLIPEIAFDQLIPVLTETLSNVARHAEATRTDVDLEISEDQLTLTVIDNGKGIKADAVHGNGLSNLEIRAKRVAGRSTVGLADGGTGTKVIWTARFKSATTPSM